MTEVSLNKKGITTTMNKPEYLQFCRFINVCKGADDKRGLRVRSIVSIDESEIYERVYAHHMADMYNKYVKEFFTEKNEHKVELKIQQALVIIWYWKMLDDNPTDWTFMRSYCHKILALL